MALRRPSIWILTVCFTLASVWAAQAAEPPTKPKHDDKPAAKAKPTKEKHNQFLRLVRDESGEPLRMETAVVRYRFKDAAKKDVTVDLVGAVHIAEKSYYDQLNKLFDDYDVVLYEL